MEIEIFTLCDFAQDNNSKLTVVGTFDSIHSKQFPFVQQNFYAFVGMSPGLCLAYQQKNQQND